MSGINISVSQNYYYTGKGMGFEHVGTVGIQTVHVTHQRATMNGNVATVIN